VNTTERTKWPQVPVSCPATEVQQVTRKRYDRRTPLAAWVRPIGLRTVIKVSPAFLLAVTCLLLTLQA
jgi:hypothetical protein